MNPLDPRLILFGALCCAALGLWMLVIGLVSGLWYLLGGFALIVWGVRERKRKHWKTLL